MSLRGSTVKHYGLPATPPTGRPGSRSWRSIYQNPAYLRSTRALTVYDILPSPLADKDYQIWTQEWLPRLVEPSDKALVPSLRNPVGFAIAPSRTPASRTSDIGPLVLHFSGNPAECSAGNDSAPTRKKKPLRRVYTKSVFRRDPKPERCDLFHESRPLSTRKRLAERTVSISSASSLPRGYRLPEGGVERERGTDVLAEVRRDNYALSERRKYVILTQALGSPRLSPTGSERGVNDGGHLAASSPRGVQDRSNGASSSIGRKGTLFHGHAWKMNDLHQGHDEEAEPLLVTNSAVKSRSFDTVKVKDALTSNETLTKLNSEEDKENKNVVLKPKRKAEI
ncbi:hypothetical protein LSH36_383g02037 [Paralvinella palmiformis]|uniref:Uncharacterized protein n=1 Tax=Paralvinella palmiformis TaxID=53620 RepID=A0AAD9N0V4_9ANNE|nr:hypothetical protein LSH36_383g02037 [Paralvinella palmiformis]